MNTSMELASKIDSTLLRVDTSLKDVEELIDEAIEFQFASVCIPPHFVRHGEKLLNGENVKLGTVAGFPLGYSKTGTKIAEIKKAIEEGAVEVDAVLNIAAVKSEEWAYVADEIEMMTRAVKMYGKTIKIILETSLLQAKEAEELVKLCIKSGVDYIKNSTGFQVEPVSESEIRVLKGLADGKIKIKAAGGIRKHGQALKLIEAGADRLGTSKAAKIAGG